MKYIHSTDRITPIGALQENLPSELIGADKPTRIAAGWYDYVATAPTSGDNEVVVCTGFVRSGDDFTGVYEVREVPPPPSHDDDATESDKDAALETLGVDMSEEA